MVTSTDSTFMQIVLVVICIAMFFIQSDIGEQSRTVATVNGVQIRDTVYFPKYREAYALNSNAVRVRVTKMLWLPK